MSLLHKIHAETFYKGAFIDKALLLLIRHCFSWWEYMRKDFVCQEDFGHKI